MKTQTSLIPFMLLLILAACSSPMTTETPISKPLPTTTSGPQPIHVRLPMGFIPDPQYAPFYVAVEKGYFREAGFEVVFDYSFETDGVALVGAAELPFAIVSGEQVILARAQELPVVYIFEWFQRYPISVISKESSNIENPQDLRDREVGLPAFFGASYVGYSGLLSANNLTDGDVVATEIGFTQVESLLTDQVDAVVGYVNNEPIQLEALNEEINIIYVADYIDMVANGLITNEALIADSPEMVESFVQATLRGLVDTLADPDNAYQISKKYVEGLDESRVNVLEASLEMWRAEILGLTDSEAWEQTQDILLEVGFLDAPLEDLSDAYTNDFILR